MTLTCSTTTAGSVTYTFLQDGVEIVSTNVELWLSEVSVAEGGTWTCTATIGNAVSSASNEHHFTVFGKAIMCNT